MRRVPEGVEDGSLTLTCRRLEEGSGWEVDEWKEISLGVTPLSSPLPPIL